MRELRIEVKGWISSKGESHHIERSTLVIFFRVLSQSMGLDLVLFKIRDFFIGGLLGP